MADWLTGGLALIGAAVGASAPSLLNRYFQTADKRQGELGELDRLIVAWEGPFSRAATTFTIGLLDNLNSDVGSKALAELDLHVAFAKLAEAKLLAARQLPLIVALLDDVELIDQKLTRTYAEFLVRKLQVGDAMLRLAELQGQRSTKLKEVHAAIHREVAPKGLRT